MANGKVGVLEYKKKAGGATNPIKKRKKKKSLRVKLVTTGGKTEAEHIKHRDMMNRGDSGKRGYRGLQSWEKKPYAEAKAKEKADYDAFRKRSDEKNKKKPGFIKRTLKKVGVGGKVGAFKKRKKK